MSTCTATMTTAGGRRFVCIRPDHGWPVGQAYVAPSAHPTHAERHTFVGEASSDADDA